MKLLRRRFLHLAAGAAALSAAPRIARAQSYPARPVRLIVSIAAGGSQDTIARLVAQGLSEKLGKQVFVENRPGAGGNLGTEIVVRAPPDGYTLFLANTSNAINATFYEKLNYNFLHDMAPIAGIGRSTGVMLVTPSLPAKDISDFIAYAKSSPEKINMASGGIGNITHLSGELFKLIAGIDMVHVPYRGEALSYPDLISGRMQVLFGGLAPAIDHIRTGRLRALGVTTRSRSRVLPDVPSISEFLPRYEAVAWYGVGAPATTPVEVIAKLNAAVNSLLLESDLGERLASLGVIAMAGSPADFGKYIVDETEKWGQVVRAADIKAE
jgi:tripartite-type tricarboxylate transporter receptor subunit TctC